MKRYTLTIGHNHGETGVEIENAEAVIFYTMDAYFEGYTFISALGVWQSGHEKSTIIKIVAEAEAEQAVRTVAELIRRRLHQQTVMLEIEQLEKVEFIG